MRALSTIDRWGPGAIALLTLLIVIGIGWIYGERIARLEGEIRGLENQVEAHAQAESQARAELSAIRNWAVAVYERGSSAGWKLPDIPTSKSIKDQGKDK